MYNFFWSFFDVFSNLGDGICISFIHGWDENLTREKSGNGYLFP